MVIHQRLRGLFLKTRIKGEERGFSSLFPSFSNYATVNRSGFLRGMKCEFSSPTWNSSLPGEVRGCHRGCVPAPTVPVPFSAFLLTFQAPAFSLALPGVTASLRFLHLGFLCEHLPVAAWLLPHPLAVYSLSLTQMSSRNTVWAIHGVQIFLTAIGLKSRTTKKDLTKLILTYFI